MVIASLLLDATVRPRRHGVLHWQGLLLHLTITTIAAGFFLACSGSVPVACALVVALMAMCTTVSNAKHSMLGEPLLFSDLALIAAVVRHPRFYFTAVSIRQRWILFIGALLLLGALVGLFVPRAYPHLIGLGMMVAGTIILALLVRSAPFRALARFPDVDVDLRHHGLITTLLLYWLRWRASMDPPACPALAIGRERPQAGTATALAAPHVIVIVQCESFADPVELTGNTAYTLPGLARARGLAAQWGDLAVSGFGAYTMRTEYGVLFGRSEAALGFRRYDPFLTAHGETSYALSARLGGAGGYHCSFVHPHDMRFYGRDRLMPAIGFDRLIGEEGFEPIPTGGGRYVDDRTLGASLADLVDKSVEPTLIYAVTMENHGPWEMDQPIETSDGLGPYLRHARSSDTMLTELIDRLACAGRSALLVFFGDHRPSMPGVTEPGGDRHTPYVMLRLSADGEIIVGENRRVDLSPDELHHAILHCATGGSQREGR